MKLSDIVTVEAVKTLLGRATGEHKASIRETRFTAIAKTPAMALQNLLQKFSAMDRFDQRRYFYTRDFKVLCLYHDFHGWAYDIVEPGSTHPTVCVLGNSYDAFKAVKAVESHVAQYDQDFENQSPAHRQIS